MHVKRYRSATVRDALARARADLGSGALVLSTQLVPARGLRGWLGTREVEVTAASDGTMSETRPDGASPRATGAAARGTTRAVTAPSRRADVRDATMEHRAGHRREHAAEDVADARGLAEPRGLTPHAPEPAMVAWQANLAARLCATGLDRALAAEIAGAFPRWRRRGLSDRPLRQAIAARLQAVAAGGESYAPVEVFIGPPGVGKTTTIAKIAARERARHGVRMPLVAADGYRVGAVEQLRLFADIIGSPFLVARTPEELEHVFATGRGPMLVDTAGRSPRDREAAGLFEVIASRPGVRTHLVLPAGAPRRDVERALEAFGDAAPSRVVLTRVDEAESVAPIVCLLRDHGLRVSFLATGQRVPEDLECATAPALAARVLGDAAEDKDVRS